ncbi:MAG: hypothetical protein AABY07_06250, partial [Nanoarchaeota archaeon]
MPASTFQYWDGAAWQTENNYLRMTLEDIMYFPMSLQVTVVNVTGNTLNSRENTYTDFMQVRVREGNTNRIVFYGKVEKIEPEYDSTYGQILHIHARQNLQELQKRTLTTSHTNFTTISAQIADIVTAYRFNSTNISTADTTKFLTSPDTFTAGQLNEVYDGSGKNALRAIAELAQMDTQNNLTGWAYYLDNEFSGNTPTPDLFYFFRGEIPPGAPLTFGLQCQFRGTEAAQVRSILPDYAFPRSPNETVTIENIIYEDESGADLRLRGILVNHGAVTAGPFLIGNPVTWPGAGAGRIEEVGNTYLIIGPSGGDNTLTTFLNTIVSQVITSGATTATVNSATFDPPGSKREEIVQDVEVFHREYGKQNIANIRRKLKGLLQQG